MLSHHTKRLQSTEIKAKLAKAKQKVPRNLSTILSTGPRAWQNNKSPARVSATSFFDEMHPANKLAFIKVELWINIKWVEPWLYCRDRSRLEGNCIVLLFIIWVNTSTVFHFNLPALLFCLSNTFLFLPSCSKANTYTSPTANGYSTSIDPSAAQRSRYYFTPETTCRNSDLKRLKVRAGTSWLSYKGDNGDGVICNGSWLHCTGETKPGGRDACRRVR